MTALTDSHIFVGNSSNVATDVAMSGDVSIDDTGATTINSFSADVNGGGKTVSNVLLDLIDNTYVKVNGTDVLFVYESQLQSNVEIVVFSDVKAEELKTNGGANHITIGDTGHLKMYDGATPVDVLSMSSSQAHFLPTTRFVSTTYFDSNVFFSGGSIDFGTSVLQDLGDPVSAQDAATKNYVDTTVSAITAGLDSRPSCRVATTAALTATYANGSSGVGATLTNSGTQAAISIDGVSLAANDRVLVKNQATAAQNGLYKVTTVGSGSTNWVLTRATDFNTASGTGVVEGAFTIIEEGTSNTGTFWIETGAGPFTIGTTAITFTQLQVTSVTDAAIIFSDITTNNVSTSKHGFAPKAPNDATKYLDGTGAYSRPSVRTTSITSSSTPTPNTDTTDNYTITALAAAPTFGAPTGSPVDGQRLTIRIKDNGTARALAWNAAYRGGGELALPTTTVISKTMYVGFMYNSADSKWDCVASIGNI